MDEPERASGGRVQLYMQPLGRGQVEDLQTMDFGGNGGIEPTRWGNVCTSFWRRSSKSEYLGLAISQADCESRWSVRLPLDDLHGTPLSGRLVESTRSAAWRGGGYCTHI
jgi:hypothetical protein